MKEHRTKRIKVNAWVDEGIVPLVEVLNLFPDVFTVDSCQGGGGKGGDAYVMFTWRGPQNKLLHFMSELSFRGGKDRNPADYSVVYKLYCGNTTGMVSVICASDLGLITAVAHSISLLAKEYGYE